MQVLSSGVGAPILPARPRGPPSGPTRLAAPGLTRCECLSGPGPSRGPSELRPDRPDAVEVIWRRLSIPGDVTPSTNVEATHGTFDAEVPCRVVVDDRFRRRRGERFKPAQSDRV